MTFAEGALSGAWDGTGGGIRTHDLRFRRPLLYPTELRPRESPETATFAKRKSIAGNGQDFTLNRRGSGQKRGGSEYVWRLCFRMTRNPQREWLPKALERAREHGRPRP